MMSFGAKFSTALVITLLAVDHTTSNPFAKPESPSAFRCANSCTAPRRFCLAAVSGRACASFSLHQTQKVGRVRLRTGRAGENIPSRKRHNQTLLLKHVQVLLAQSAAHPHAVRRIRQFEQPPIEAILE